MPDGVVWWFDPKDEEGRILHAGRTYTVRSTDMEPSSRVPGARVHFDVDPSRPGAATGVTLRPGTRVSRRQHRFGDLSGARRADTKGRSAHAVDRPELGRDLEAHPKRAVEAWATMLADGRLDDAMLLFAPDAVLHADGQVWVGKDQVRTYWSRSPLLGSAEPTTIEGLSPGNGDRFAVRWSRPDGGVTETLLTVAHGVIREQRHDEVASDMAEGVPELPVVVSSDGSVSSFDRSRAVKIISRVAATSGQPVLHADVRLHLAADPARPEPAKARATIDLNGEPMRAHATGRTMTEAIDRLDQRLRDRLDHVASHRRALRRRGPGGQPGTWRHGDRDSDRAPFFPRPADEREIVRHKTASPVDVTLDEAVFDLEAMDHDFLLYRDLATGADAVVSRTPVGRYTVQHLDGPKPSAPANVATIDVDPRVPSELSLPVAREILDETNRPWVFFRNPDSGRGEVLYRRYDGHYGRIVSEDGS